MIATAGINAPAAPRSRLIYRRTEDGSWERYEKFTNISGIPQEYFSFAQRVVVHNHRRQGILAMERAIETRNWAFRIVCSVLGMILVDAYRMYHAEMHREQDGAGLMPFRQFSAKVAYELCTNSLVDHSAR
jgi:hypothetical protein